MNTEAAQPERPPEVVEQLETIKAEQQLVSDRLQRMQARRGDVAEAVYLRVHADYQRQAEALASRARPLQQAVRELLRQERERLAELEAACSSADLDRQEAEFRHALGEFDEAELRARVEAIEAQLGQTRRQREASEALIERMRAAFIDPALIDAPEAPAHDDAADPAAAEPAAAPRDGASSSEPEPVGAPAAMAPAGAEELASTLIMPTLNATPTAAASPPAAASTRTASGASTTILRTAQLIPQNPVAGLKPYTLGLRGATIGSDPSCEIRIAGIGVAGAHARISVSARGFTIEDLGAPAGTRVGGEKIQSQLLKNEDLIQIGAARFLFKDR